MRDQGSAAAASTGTAGWPVSPVVAEVRTSDPRLRRVLWASFASFGIRVLGPDDDRGTADVLVWALEPDTGEAALERLHPAVRVLVLVEAPSPDAVSRLLALGAKAVLDRAGDPETIAHAAVSVARGYLVLPSERSAALLPSFITQQLTGEELGWMQALATGQDVGALAEVVGISEREMYRKLRAVYGKLRTATRAGALRRLARAGLLVEEP
jgi:DNA-binding NarL/FixJ family response regulator